jgi:hypothetical protein
MPAVYNKKMMLLTLYNVIIHTLITYLCKLFVGVELLCIDVN